MRGFFAIGVEGISKPFNVANMIRSAYAFGASYFFMLAPNYNEGALNLVDTSAAAGHLPIFTYPDVAGLAVPSGAKVVGVEFTEDSIPLPSFRHPRRAVYVLGSEAGSLSPQVQARCNFIVRIPMRFCVNVGIAGALVMYDRLLTLGNHAPRPGLPGGPIDSQDLVLRKAQARRSRVVGPRD
jgi:tRNA G18 (ribose-2'-O)-methylase SpoU